MVDKPLILVVDDEPKILAVVESYLENAGYNVCTAQSGKEALELFAQRSPHFVVLDLMLPDLSGEQVCAELRKSSRVPILMLTAKAGEDDILNGLNIGADDYLTKPFSPRQLVARVGAILRRAGEPGPLQNILTFDGGLTIDLAARKVLRQGEEATLTPHEFEILALMARHPGQVFSRDRLITGAMGYDYDGYDRVIDTHIKNLRQKLESDPKNPRYIQTVYGVGYRFGAASQRGGTL